MCVVVCGDPRVAKPGFRPGSDPGPDLGQTWVRPGSMSPWANLGPTLVRKKSGVVYTVQFQVEPHKLSRLSSAPLVDA